MTTRRELIYEFNSRCERNPTQWKGVRYNKFRNKLYDVDHLDAELPEDQVIAFRKEIDEVTKGDKK